MKRKPFWLFVLIALLCVPLIVVVCKKVIVPKEAEAQDRIAAQYRNIQEIPAKWQQIDKFTSRMWIPEGWIVRCFSSHKTGNHFIIAKDPKHIWRIK